MVQNVGRTIDSSFQKINIRILPKRRPQGKPAPKRLNVVSLDKQAVSTELKETLEERAQHIQISDNVVESWEAFRDEVYRAAYETIGQTKRKHQDWFDENNDEINNVLEEKYRIQRVLKTTNRLQTKLPTTTFAVQSSRDCDKCRTHC